MRRSLGSLVAISLLAGPVAAQVGSPAGPVPVERLQARRDALLKRLGTGVAIVRSAELKSIEGDYPQDSDYRERNDFFYLTGLEAPGGTLVLVAQDTQPDRAVLFLPARNPASERWTGPQLGPGPEATALTGIGEVHAADSMTQVMRPFLAVARRGALYIYRTEEELEAPAIRSLVYGPGAARIDALDRHIAALRQVKDADEIARLRKAIDITAEAHREVMRTAAPGMWEYELEATIEHTFRRRGAERVGFPSIIGSGINSTTLHYDKNRRRTEPGDLVVMDIGAEYGYYSADVTRTIPISGKFTARQRAIYDLVHGAHRAAIDSVRPGITLGRLQQIAQTYMRDHSGTTCGDQPCTRYFIHGLSHWLGMDVHDVGQFNVPLEAGMVFTIEPGIYIPEERLGVRIEDDILVTATGAEVLSAAAPTTAAEVERAMAARKR